MTRQVENKHIQISKSAVNIRSWALTIFSLLIIGALIIVTHRNWNVESGIKLIAVGLIGNTLIYLIVPNCRKVEMDADCLYISNWRKKIKIPLASIEKIKDGLFHYKTINFDVTFSHHIYLKEETEFGRKMGGVFRNHDITSRRNDNPLGEGVIDALSQTPVRQVNRIALGIEKLNKLGQLDFDVGVVVNLVDD